MGRTSIPELNSFPCPKCMGRMDVRDSRPTIYRSKQAVRRRRRCNKCGFRVTTFESIGSENDFADARLPKIIAAAREAKDAIEVMIEQFDSGPDGTARGSPTLSSE
jgi:transcriptional regulator NrdR family protein